MKRWIGILLTLCLVLTMAPGLWQTAWAGTVAEGTCGDGLTWTLDEEGTLTISGMGPMRDYKNNSYGFPWKNHMSSIKTVILEEGVTTITARAFTRCSQLTAVTFPESMTEIGEYAFQDCTGLTAADIPDSVTAIGPFVFSGCSGLSSVRLSAGLTSIPTCAFYNCTQLESVTIPDSVTSIGEQAFQNTGLVSVTIPGSVSRVEGRAFRGCKSLSDVTIPDGVTYIGDYAFEGCYTLKQVTVPESVTQLGAYVFQDCESLTEAALPHGLTKLAATFTRCYSLAEITIPDSVTELDGTFEDCRSLTEITIPQNVTRLGDRTFSGCTGLTEILVPERVSYFGSSLFRGCTGLTGITIPEGVHTIGSDCFRECTGLTEITVPDSVTAIGNNAFRDCTNLADITLGEGVGRIYNNAFEGCTGLARMTIPYRVSHISYKAFHGCTSLSEVYFTGNAPLIDSDAFLDITANAYYPDDDDTWTQDVFQDYGGILTWTSYTVSDTIADSGQCGDDLTWIRYNRGRLVISGTGPMWDYSDEDPAPWQDKIETLVIGEGATSIGTFAFARCGSLKRVFLPDTLNAIGYEAFYDDGAITRLEFPENLTAIGGRAFSVCVNLKQVIFWGSAPSIGENAFGGCTLAAYYNDSDDTWYENSGTDQDHRQDYGGRICWAAVMANPELPERMAGQTRTETAVAISRNTFDEGAENVVICSGDNYPDALAGAPLAYMLDAPILLVCHSKPDQATLDEITRLGARNAYILGGTGVVSDSVADQMKDMGLNVKRIAGRTRFETAVAVAKEMDEITGGKPQAVFFAYANNYPDALSISNVAAIAGVPILYIGGSGVLDEATKAYMDSCGSIEGSIILGGPALIKEKAEKELGGYGEVERIYGHDRYETCILINLTFRDILNGDSLCVACGTNYPDALAGSVFAAYCHAPLLLVGGKSLTQLQQEYANWKAPVNVFAFGGTYVLPQNLVNQIKQYTL